MLLWIGFGVLVLVMMTLDLGVFNRRAHAVTMREAALWTAAWVGVALFFNVVVYFTRGPEAGLQFLTGYLLEESLSVDNMFVFLMLFTYFAVRPEHQHRVLFWGIVGAMLMRGLFIAVGVSLLHRFHWVIYLFGALLIYTGYKMASPTEAHIHPEHNPILRVARRFLPVTKDYDGERFFTLSAGRWMVTPLFLVLLIIESTDVVFALDSVPAVLGVSHDAFIIYTSNIFAILGLRSLYFLLHGMMGIFRYLKFGLAVILAFIGAKMLLSGVLEIHTSVSLAVVFGVLLASVLASLVIQARERESEETP